MEVLHAYAYSTAGWLALQALGLLISPKLSIVVLCPESRVPTSVEEYLSRALGFSLLALALLTVQLTGVLPLTSTVAGSISADESQSQSPYAVFVVTVSLCFQSVMAFYCYSQYLHTGLSAFGLDVAVYGGLGAMGLWCLLFASSGGKINRKTGADKRTSGFPFTNAEADKRKMGKKTL